MSDPKDAGWIPLYSTGITTGTINANAAAQPQPSLLAKLEASDPSLISNAPLNSSPSTGVNPAPYQGPVPPQVPVIAISNVASDGYVNDPNKTGAASAQPQHRVADAIVQSSRIRNPA